MQFKMRCALSLCCKAGGAGHRTRGSHVRRRRRRRRHNDDSDDIMTRADVALCSELVCNILYYGVAVMVLVVLHFRVYAQSVCSKSEALRCSINTPEKPFKIHTHTHIHTLARISMRAFLCSLNTIFMVPRTLSSVRFHCI